MRHPRSLHIDLEMYIKVVPGEFDELLSWPCKELVRVTCNFRDMLFDGISKSHVTDIETDREPWYRPLNDDHHAYRHVLDVTILLIGTILKRVNRE